MTAAPRLSDVDELLAAPLRRSGVVVEVAVDPRLDLAESVELAVYRITQEALTNVARHARATRAWVEVTGDDRRVRLRVTDDGVGPGPARRVTPGRVPGWSASPSGSPASEGAGPSPSGPGAARPSTSSCPHTR